jgi:hypothetical protein
MIMVPYADDVMLGFEHETDARRFWDAIRDRLLRGMPVSLRPTKRGETAGEGFSLDHARGAHELMIVI